MWTALRTDLREFVSTVAEESTNALTALDSTLVVRNKENNDENNETGEVILHEDGEVSYVPSSSNVEIDESKNEEEKERLFNLEKDMKTYTEKLTEEEKNFDLNEVSSIDTEYILKTRSHLKDIYDLLINSENEGGEETGEDLVTEEEFWLRYYARCYRYYTIEEDQNDEDEESPGNRVISGIFKLMEGAARQLDAATDSQRPPFVLNTAVDDEDDEEELAWDDDDEDDEEEEKEGGEHQNLIDTQKQMEQEIEQKYDEKCTQLEEERDALHQTVELQREEIADLNLLISQLKEKIKMQDLSLKEFNIGSKLLQKPQEEQSSTSEAEEKPNLVQEPDHDPCKSSETVHNSSTSTTPMVPEESGKIEVVDDWGDDEDAWGN